jgi:uncharacterized membrane protein
MMKKGGGFGPDYETFVSYIIVFKLVEDMRRKEGP